MQGLLSSSRVSNVAQILIPGPSGRFDNLIDIGLPFGASAALLLRASRESISGEPKGRLTFRFKTGRFLLKEVLFGGDLAVPYPVPFDLLGPRAIGYLDTTVLQDDLRVSVGNKGTTFVFRRETDPTRASLAVGSYDRALEFSEAGARETELETELNAAIGLNAAIESPKRPVILCPAQFSGPKDYGELCALLRARGHPVYVARLTLWKWLSLLKNFGTSPYWSGSLTPEATVDFYLDSIKEAVERCRAAQGEGAEYSLVAHSIGGWIARAWLGGGGGVDGCRSLVMLGTPNQPPPEGSVWEKLDQSRGLLDNVNRRFPGSFRKDVRYTCVVSERVQGGFTGGLEGLLAFASYLPLGGKGDSRGDGITPAEGGKMEGCDCVVLKDAGHFDFLPNPLGVRVPLANATWYGSEEQLDHWLDCV